MSGNWQMHTQGSQLTDLSIMMACLKYTPCLGDKSTSRLTPVEIAHPELTDKVRDEQVGKPQQLNQRLDIPENHMSIKQA